MATRRSAGVDPPTGWSSGERATWRSFRRGGRYLRLRGVTLDGELDLRDVVLSCVIAFDDCEFTARPVVAPRHRLLRHRRRLRRLPRTPPLWSARPVEHSAAPDANIGMCQPGTAPWGGTAERPRQRRLEQIVRLLVVSGDRHRQTKQDRERAQTWITTRAIRR